jgi:hypothetical protein
VLAQMLEDDTLQRSTLLTSLLGGIIGEDEMIGGALVTLEKIRVIRYRSY